MNRSEIESEIRRVLESETNAIPLSNKLFQPDGLFAKLATNAAERRELTKTPLFQEANRRLSTLQRSEMAEFKEVAAELGSPPYHGVMASREEVPAG